MKRRNFIWYSLLFSGGCTVASTPNNISNKLPKQLIFTVTEAKSLQELQRDYGAFRTALQDVLEIKIDFLPVENFVAAAPALQLGQVDLVLAGPSEAVTVKGKIIKVVTITAALSSKEFDQIN